MVADPSQVFPDALSSRARVTCTFRLRLGTWPYIWTIVLFHHRFGSSCLPWQYLLGSGAAPIGCGLRGCDARLPDHNPGVAANWSTRRASSLGDGGWENRIVDALGGDSDRDVTRSLLSGGPGDVDGATSSPDVVDRGFARVTDPLLWLGFVALVGFAFGSEPSGTIVPCHEVGNGPCRASSGDESRVENGGDSVDAVGNWYPLHCNDARPFRGSERLGAGTFGCMVGLSEKKGVAMELTYECPECDASVRVPHAESGGNSTCPGCQTVRGHQGASALDLEGLKHCMSCGTEDLYLQKDFPQGLGLVIVVVGFAISTVFWYYRMPLWSYAILLSSALLDLVLYYRVPDVTICYRCLSQHRGPGARPDGRFRGFDLAVGERYRQERLRVEEHRRRKSASG